MAFIKHDESLDALDCSAQQFVLWAFTALELPPRECAKGVYVLERAGGQGDSTPSPPYEHADLAGRQFTFDAAENQSFLAQSPIEHLTWQSPSVRWLLDALRGGGRLVHALSAHQPLSVHELAEHIFAQYKVDGGHMHLGGCRLEDRPFLRLTFRNGRVADGESQLIHCFGTSDGKLIEPVLWDQLELSDLVAWPGRPPRIDEKIVERWVDLTRQQISSLQDGDALSLIATTLVWCKYAEGKLALTIGAKSVEVPFSGWGRLLVDRRTLPPPYYCPLSGCTSYHLAATDDGRITTAEAIATCSESSRRVLRHELTQCAVSGRLALPQYLQVCPVTGETVLSSLFEVCSMCRQQVSARVLVDSRCPACRQLTPVSKAESGLARVLEAYPQLDSWRNWRSAETRSVWVLVASSAWKRLLIVVEKQSLGVRHMAIGSRMTSKWVEATGSQRTQWLGS